MKSDLSPIEKLRAERIALDAEIKVHEAKLKENLSYAKSNWGSLLLSSVFPSTTGSFKSLLGLSSKGENSGSGGFDFYSLLDKFTLIGPFAWRIIQPVLLGLLTKKISSFFFGRKKKK